MDPNSRPVSDQQPMTKKSETLLIATSTIGGAILVVFVIYVIIRMRRGATLVDVLKLRRAGTEQIVDTNDYPIQWEQRYSVRSSHHPSLTIATRRQKNMPPLPLPVTQRFNSRDAYYRHYWKDRAQPNTPVNIISSWFMKGHTPSPTAKPEMIHPKLKTKAQSTVRHSTMTQKSAAPTHRMSKTSNAPTVSVRDLSIAEVEPPTPSSSNEKYTRWSWTNSEAPSTPRINLGGSRRDSVGSSKKYRPTSSWVSYQMDAIDENTATPAASSLALPMQANTNSPDQPKGLRTFFNTNSAG